MSKTKIRLDRDLQPITAPFRSNRALRDKFGRVLIRASSLSVFHIAFNSSENIVWIEQQEYRGAHHELMATLREPFIQDCNNYRSEENYQWISGDELARRLNLGAHAMRQRVRKLRRDVEQDLRERLGWNMDKNDIIENKPWKGYRLNPISVRLVAWNDIQREGR